MKTFRITVTVLLIGWMILIFSLSAATAAESSATSSGVIEFLAKIFIADFDEISVLEQESIIESLQFIVRKTAHFTLYGVLGGLAFLSVITYTSVPFPLRTAISAAICLLYAISDEIHQIFVPGRSGEIRDVCIDFAGSILAILILVLLSRWKKLKKFI
ncbi:MAG: VanZ family protein [Ruminococcaceae bacterium]|nr:VanZ family protein [Oscillospiraceae bacterium]